MDSMVRSLLWKREKRGDARARASQNNRGKQSRLFTKQNNIARGSLFCVFASKA